MELGLAVFLEGANNSTQSTPRPVKLIIVVSCEEWSGQGHFTKESLCKWLPDDLRNLLCKMYRRTGRIRGYILPPVVPGSETE